MGQDIFTMNSEVKNLSDITDSQNKTPLRPSKFMDDNQLSASAFHVNSKNCILRYNQKENDTQNETSLFDMKHGQGYDWNDVMEGFNSTEIVADGAQQTSLRKINKMPFKVLDAPQL